MRSKNYTVIAFVIVQAGALITVSTITYSAFGNNQDTGNVSRDNAQGPAANDSVKIANSKSANALDENTTSEEPAEQNIEAEVPANERKLLGFESGLFQIGPTGADITEAGEEEESFLSGWLPDGTGELGRTLGALAIVIGILLLIFSVMRRMGNPLTSGRRPSGVLEILARYPVARGQRLLLLKVDRRVLLVHQCGTAMSTLTEFSNSEEVASLLAKIEAGSRSKSSRNFEKVLAKVDEGYNSTTNRSAVVETIDLTRTQVGGLGRVLGRRHARI